MDDVAGASNAVYVTSTLSVDTYDYRVVVTQDAGCEVTSDPITITVVGDPTVSVVADDLDICAGGTINLTATVTGGTGTNNYQWQFYNAGTWENINGAMASIYSTVLIDANTYRYRVIVTQDAGCSIVGSATVITVVEDPDVTITADEEQYVKVEILSSLQM